MPRMKSGVTAHEPFEGTEPVDEARATKTPSTVPTTIERSDIETETPSPLRSGIRASQSWSRKREIHDGHLGHCKTPLGGAHKGGQQRAGRDIEATRNDPGLDEAERSRR